MSDTKFTPGPWRLGTSGLAIWGGDVVVADAWESNDLPDKECEANAHLIAAAPEMYEALLALANRFSYIEGTQDGHLISAATAALAKAGRA